VNINDRVVVVFDPLGALVDVDDTGRCGTVTNVTCEGAMIEVQLDIDKTGRRHWLGRKCLRKESQ
jgi:hypothetical protein